MSKKGGTRTRGLPRLQICARTEGGTAPTALRGGGWLAPATEDSVRGVGSSRAAAGGPMPAAFGRGRRAPGWHEAAPGPPGRSTRPVRACKTDERSWTTSFAGAPAPSPRAQRGLGAEAHQPPACRRWPPGPGGRSPPAPPPRAEPRNRAAPPPPHQHVAAAARAACPRELRLPPAGAAGAARRWGR